jgi:hypothetical protein
MADFSLMQATMANVKGGGLAERSMSPATFGKELTPPGKTAVFRREVSIDLPKKAKSALGCTFKVHTSGSGVEVKTVDDSGPAADVLSVGERVVEIGGKDTTHFTTYNQIAATVKASSQRSSFELVVAQVRTGWSRVWPYVCPLACAAALHALCSPPLFGWGNTAVPPTQSVERSSIFSFVLRTSVCACLCVPRL